jgi:carbamoyltransferase
MNSDDVSSRMNTVIGINRTQDASISMFSGGTHVLSIQKERLTKEKHAWGKPGDLALYLDKLPQLQEPTDVLIECFSSDKELENSRIYEEEIAQLLPKKEGFTSHRISHHLAHAYSAFFPSGYEEAAVMIVDFVGSHVKNFSETEMQHGPDPEHLEVASFYHGKNAQLTCLKKQTWTGDRSRPVGLGIFYHRLTQCIFPGEGNEGKVMGLSSYGDASALDLPALEVREGEVHIPAAWMTVLNDPERFLFFTGGRGSFGDCADLAASGQRAFENALLEIARWLFETTGCKNLCFAGGCALNCVANGVLAKRSEFSSIFIPPAAHDGGTSLGCAIYGLREILKQPVNFRWENDFLGPAHEITEAEISSVSPDLIITRPADLAAAAAEIIAYGNIIALFQSSSEFGPRALGHRSIIADPRYSVMRTWINEAIKGREWFRPVAPIVLEEDAGEFFDLGIASPFMQFAAGVKPAYLAKLAAITHIDGTARLQTVSPRQDIFLHSLLTEFKRRSGIGVLVNTSLNGPGTTIVETLAEALAFFEAVPFHSMVCPPFLVQKKNAPPSPLHLKNIRKAIS